jgi:hypothetical protein
MHPDRQTDEMLTAAFRVFANAPKIIIMIIIIIVIPAA